MKVRTQTLINAPPETVFRLATDIARWQDRIPVILRIEVLTPGPVRIGTVFRETRIMFGREATEEMTVAELEPPRRFALTATNHGASYFTLHEFEHQGSATRVAVTFEARPLTFGAWLLQPLGWLMKGMLRRMLDSNLAALKTACEQGTQA